jgi:hypothetical protein
LTSTYRDWGHIEKAFCVRSNDAKLQVVRVSITRPLVCTILTIFSTRFFSHDPTCNASWMQPIPMQTTTNRSSRCYLHAHPHATGRDVALEAWKGRQAMIWQLEATPTRKPAWPQTLAITSYAEASILRPI